MQMGYPFINNNSKSLFLQFQTKSMFCLLIMRVLTPIHPPMCLSRCGLIKLFEIDLNVYKNILISIYFAEIYSILLRKE